MAGGFEPANDLGDVPVPGLQVGERRMGGEVGDAGEVGGDGGGEEFGLGVFKGVEEVGARVVVGFGRKPDAGRVGAFADGGGVVAGGVQPGAVAGSGQGDVAGLPVQAAWPDDEHLVAGHPLGLVDGDGVAVVDMAGADVVAVDDDAPTAHQVDGHVAAVGVEGGDGADHPVVDPARPGTPRRGVEAGVAGEDDPVTGLELAVTDVEDGTGQEAGGGSSVAAVTVEGAGFGTGAGEEEGVAAVPVGLPPVADGGSVNVLEAVVEDDAVVVVVGVEGGGDVAVAELIEGVDLPRFGLPAVDGQLGTVCAGGVDGGGEPSPGGDLRKLMMVTDEDHLGPGDAGGADDPMQVDGAEPSRLRRPRRRAVT